MSGLVDLKGGPVGHTALHAAAGGGHHYVCELLLSADQQSWFCKLAHCIALYREVGQHPSGPIVIAAWRRCRIKGRTALDVAHLNKEKKEMAMLELWVTHYIVTIASMCDHNAVWASGISSKLEFLYTNHPLRNSVVYTWKDRVKQQPAAILEFCFANNYLIYSLIRPPVI